MTPEQAQKLRAPFKQEQIGKLPKPTKRDNPKGKCNECGGWHGLPAVHLDYVGHAAVTDRLLEVDPEWSWEPMAVGPNGEPLMTNGGLWIKLTIAGVTRPGFGDEGNGKGMKEVIGDAIRNAAMRFGVALDLWSKEDLHGSEGEPKAATTAAGQPSRAKAAVSQAENTTPPQASDEPASPSDTPFTDKFEQARAQKDGVSTTKQQKQIGDLIVKLAELRGQDIIEATEKLEANEGKSLNDLSAAEADVLIGKLERWRKNHEKAAA